MDLEMHITYSYMNLSGRYVLPYNYNYNYLPTSLPTQLGYLMHARALSLPLLYLGMGVFFFILFMLCDELMIKLIMGWVPLLVGLRDGLQLWEVRERVEDVGAISMYNFKSLLLTQVLILKYLRIHEVVCLLVYLFTCLSVLSG